MNVKQSYKNYTYTYTFSHRPLWAGIKNGLLTGIVFKMPFMSELILVKGCRFQNGLFFFFFYIQRKRQNYEKNMIEISLNNRREKWQIAKLSSFPAPPSLTLSTASISPSRPCGWRRQSKNSSRWIVRSLVTALPQATKHKVGWMNILGWGRGAARWRSGA